MDPERINGEMTSGTPQLASMAILMAQPSDSLRAGCLVISPQAPLLLEDTPSQWGRGAESWHPEAAHQHPQAHPCSCPQQRAGHLSHPGAAAKDPLGPGLGGRALETTAGSPPLWRSPPCTAFYRDSK